MKTIKNTAIGLTLFIFLTLIFLSCSSATEPKIEVAPSGRDYVWTADTLITPKGLSVTPTKMWGSSESDLWAVGPSYSNYYTIWHYDGKKWKNDTVDDYCDPRGVWGTAKDNVWIGGIDGAFWHYNGVKWSKFCTVKVEGFDNFVVQSMCGRSANDIYAVGCATSHSYSKYYKGGIFHYDGAEWKQVAISDINFSFYQILPDNRSNGFLICSVTFSGNSSTVYAFDGKTLTEIPTDSTLCSIDKIGDNLYRVAGTKIYKYENSRFVFFKDFEGTDFSARAWGQGENNFFTINYGGIGHYNGSDLTTVEKTPNNYVTQAESIMIGNDFFSVWWDILTNYVVIYHGKPKTN